MLVIASSVVPLLFVASNEWIATGSQAIFEGDKIQWANLPDSVLNVLKKVARGPLVTTYAYPLREAQACVDRVVAKSCLGRL